MKKNKIVEVGQYPPPNTGWSVRIKQLREAFDKDPDIRCKVLKLGQGREIKSREYIDVQGGLDYIIKLFRLRFNGYIFHLHTNANAVKGPLLVLIATLISLLFFKAPITTFHGGLKQIYFPRKQGGKWYWLIYLNFLLAGKIICNDEDIKNAIAEYGSFINKKKIHAIPAFSIQHTKFTTKQLPSSAVEFIAEKKHLIVSYIALREGYFVNIVLDLLDNLPKDTGVLFTGIGKVEDDSVLPLYTRLLNMEKEGKICVVENLDHNQFMTLLSTCHIYFRPYMYDGVSSSVLESLSLGTPVVACDNGRRPRSVVTYKADDSEDLKKNISYVLNNYNEIKSSIIKPLIEDTVKIEIKVINDYIKK